MVIPMFVVLLITALSTDELSRVKRFAILVSSETDGAVVRLASPPTIR